MIYQHDFPNIVPGMPFDASLFNDGYEFYTGRMAEYFRVASAGVGGLISPNGELGLVCEIDSRQLTIHQLTCITSVGALVRLSATATDPPECIPLDSLLTGRIYRLRLHAAFKPQRKYGPQEKQPTRSAFIRPEHTFRWVEINDQQPTPAPQGELDLVQLRWKEDGSLMLDENYSPNCLQIGSHPLLKEYANVLKSEYQALHQYSVRVAHRSNTGRSIAERQLQQFTLSLGYRLAATIASYQGISDNDSPDHLLEPWVYVAGLLAHFIEVTNIPQAASLDAFILANTQVAGYSQAGLTRNDLRQLANIPGEAINTELDHRLRATVAFARKMTIFFGQLTYYNAGDDLRERNHYSGTDSSVQDQRTSNGHPF